MTARKILTAVGARPQFIKAAAVSRAIESIPELSEVMVHTGQHFDQEMSAIFFDELAIPAPAYQLDIHGGGHGDMTGRMLMALEPLMVREAPDMVMVYGDTNSTLAGALTAAKLHIPVAHVEAGLRSFNRSMPEEVNRVLTDHLSALLFCPTTAAIDNLHKEGVRHGIHHSGDVMFDASLFAAERADSRSNIIERLGLGNKSFGIATVHRAENTDSRDALLIVLEYLKKASEERLIVFPVHPRTRIAAERFGLSFDGLLTCEPIGYLDMALLLRKAHCVYTDSGGLQKEAYFYRRPCITLRPETEWVETVEAGWNRLWRGPPHSERRDIDDYGDGHAAGKMVAGILAYLSVFNSHQNLRLQSLELWHRQFVD